MCRTWYNNTSDNTATTFRIDLIQKNGSVYQLDSSRRDLSTKTSLGVGAFPAQGWWSEWAATLTVSTQNAMGDRPVLGRCGLWSAAVVDAVL